MIQHNPIPDAMKPTPTDIDLYARALALSHAPRQTPVHHRILDFFYWAGIMAAFGWVFSMAIDRDPPVKQLVREIVSPNRQVRVGDRLLIHGVRVRTRSCEIARRWWIIDGAGRRNDFETERFDAYGPLGRDEEVIGPYIPLDAMPGRGRLMGVVAYDCNLLQRAWLVDHDDPAAARIRNPASGPGAVNCVPPGQDLGHVWALVALLVGIIAGRALPREPPG